MRFDIRFLKSVSVLAGLFLSMIFFSGVCSADPKDYRLELVDKAIQVRNGAILHVRVVNVAAAQVVSDADIRVSSLDMSPDGMAGMRAKVAPAPGTDAGIYAFSADLPMAGLWALSIEARIPGEVAPVRAKLLIRVR